jgi:hypothetical protein
MTGSEIPELRRKVINVAAYERAERWSSAREKDGIQTGDAKYSLKSWAYWPIPRITLLTRVMEVCSGESTRGVVFKTRSLAFISHTLLAHHNSTAQLAKLIAPTQRTPILVLVVEIIAEIIRGAMSLQVRSIRLITALRFVKSWGCPSGSAAVTTKSRSIDSILPCALNVSEISKTKIRAKAPYLANVEIWGVKELVSPTLGSTIKSHKTEAAMTESLLIEIVVERVFSRWGDLSTHLPMDEERHIDARVRMIPLQDFSITC